MKFVIDNKNGMMSVGSCNLPISTAGLASNVDEVYFNGEDGQILYNDRPPFPVAISDPSPYQSCFNLWLAAAAALATPLTAAQAIQIKSKLVDMVFDFKRQKSIQLSFGDTYWATNSSSVAPGNNSSTLWTIDPTKTNAISIPIAYNSGAYGSTGVLTSNNGKSSGKFYWEHYFYSNPGFYPVSGIIKAGTSLNNILASNLINNNIPSYSYNSINGYKYGFGVNGSAYGSTWYAAVIGHAFDATAGNLWFSLNGVWQGGATAAEIAAGTTAHAAFTGIPSGTYHAAVAAQSTQAATGLAVQEVFGNTGFYYSPPAGFSSLSNLQAVNIDCLDRSVAQINASISGGVAPTLYDTVTGSQITTISSTQLPSVLAGIGSRANTLVPVRQSLLAAIAACTTVAQVIAIDVTAGWPY